MPIPKPRDDEKQEEFISRCMGDELMVKEYPDQKQRAAVCYSQWRDKDKEEKGTNVIPEERDITGLYQLRYFEPGELRVDGVKEKRLYGYAAVFNSLSEQMWGFREKISKGAFSESVAKDDIRALWNHNPDFPLGRNKAKTLFLAEDDHGLSFEVVLPDTQIGRDIAESIRRGDVTQNSFGFVLESKDHESWDKEAKVRTLNKVKLFDVSPVTYPAYKNTEAHVRSLTAIYHIAPAGPVSPHVEEPKIITPTPPLVDAERWAKLQEKRRRR